jgi:acyl-CoA thioester hydrolase
VSNRGIGEPVTIVIRWRDLDALGHVNSAVFATYFEEAREAWLLRALNRMVRREEIVVARIEIDYLRPVNLQDEELLGSTRLLATGEKRLITDERLSTRRWHRGRARDGDLGSLGSETLGFAEVDWRGEGPACRDIERSGKGRSLIGRSAAGAGDHSRGGGEPRSLSRSRRSRPSVTRYLPDTDLDSRGMRAALCAYIGGCTMPATYLGRAEEVRSQGERRAGRGRVLSGVPRPLLVQVERSMNSCTAVVQASGCSQKVMCPAGSQRSSANGMAAASRRDSAGRVRMSYSPPITHVGTVIPVSRSSAWCP